ncbi:MAG: ethanolamine utilization protein EutP [Clostridia bacterium]|nr:ethanolamine utilization protein EutP [Clostridia bacterium]MBQ3553712.1 ethanolamine utilization protein EutP [Clostridia bacterium]
MKKIILMGRSECGKTSLTQAMRGETVTYKKTQYINHYDVIIDTPGEYAENHHLARALALYAYEADVVGFLLSATEPYSLYSPNCTSMANREVIGIVTQIDQPNANPERAERWLRLTGCKTVYHTSAKTGEGISDILEHLREEGDVLPWDKNQEEKIQKQQKTTEKQQKPTKTA